MTQVLSGKKKPTATAINMLEHGCHGEIHPIFFSGYEILGSKIVTKHPKIKLCPLLCHCDGQLQTFHQLVRLHYQVLFSNLAA
jgi:hypothetical protein